MEAIPSLEQSLEHAARIVGPRHAANFVFRCGPCDVCGGACLCRPDDELIARAKTGLKPVSTFAFRSKRRAFSLEARLQQEGLACWTARNRWKMWIVVASARPDEPVGSLGSPREVAFTQEFIDERLPLRTIGAMHGYNDP